MLTDLSGAVSRFTPNESCSWIIAPVDPNLVITSLMISFDVLQLHPQRDRLYAHEGEYISSSIVASFPGTSSRTLLVSGVWICDEIVLTNVARKYCSAPL